MKQAKTVVVCSGGLDSVSMSSRYKRDDVTLLTFNYGQKGVKEMEVVKKLAEKMNWNIKTVDISFMKSLYGEGNQLTSEGVSVKDGYDKTVVVPLRNGVFLTIALAYSYANDIEKIALGSHLDDITEVDGERFYPDCSPEFFKSMELAGDLGTFREQKRVVIETPSILGIGKTELMKIGHKNLGDFVFETWSCYYSGEKHCGKCESCRNRKKAFLEAGIEDKTEYVE